MGLGGLVMAAILTLLLHPVARRVESRGLLLALGMLAGLPLGLAATLLSSLLYWGFAEGMRMSWTWWIMSLSGGAGLGFGCALVVPLRPREAEIDIEP